MDTFMLIFLYSAWPLNKRCYFKLECLCSNIRQTSEVLLQRLSLTSIARMSPGDWWANFLPAVICNFVRIVFFCVILFVRLHLVGNIQIYFSLSHALKLHEHYSLQSRGSSPRKSAKSEIFLLQETGLYMWVDHVPKYYEALSTLNHLNRGQKGVGVGVRSQIFAEPLIMCYTWQGLVCPVSV